MKRITTAALLIGLLFAVACKKDGGSTSIGNWTFGGTKYNATGAVFSSSDSSLNATCNGGKLTVYFPTGSIQSGSYLIVNYDSVPLQAGQMYLRFINTSTSQYYFSTGSENVSAQVSVLSSGKTTVSIPPVYLESYANPTPYIAQLSAVITQQ